MEMLAQVTGEAGLAPWQVTTLISVVAAFVGASGGWIGAAVLARKNAVDDRHTLIDQLQEERDKMLGQLDAERAERRADREAAEKRNDQFWTDKAMSRQHVAELRSHIYQKLPPPPPNPPAGYIE